MFEVGSMVFPAAKAGLLAKLGKVEVFNHLMTKGRLIGARARQAMAVLRTPLQVTRMCFVAGTLVKAKQGLIKIEDVQPGMEVWSRDEFTQQEGWKPVVQTFITHPAELHHLTYEVRGPPAEGETMHCETLGVTAPHPFWVSSRSKPGFVPAGELRAGDELHLANGGEAIVTANTRETAPLGETFTTYNFEVADFHTYFAGRSEVWVHNKGHPCKKVLSIYKRFRERGHGPWEAFKHTVDKTPGVPSQTYGLAAGEAMEEIYRLAAAGENVTIPTHKMVKELMRGRNIEFDEAVQKFGDEWADINNFNQDVWLSLSLESHHSIPSYVQKLMKSGITQSEIDNIPSFLTSMHNHTREIDSLHSVINKHIPETAAGRITKFGTANPSRTVLLTALGNAYAELNMTGFWNVVKNFAP
ncbi:MAG: polymorphic toxin-type HINT domain-containing protein [Verrucomicrobiaceae bacterium]